MPGIGLRKRDLSFFLFLQCVNSTVTSRAWKSSEKDVENHRLMQQMGPNSDRKLIRPKILITSNEFLAALVKTSNV